MIKQLFSYSLPAPTELHWWQYGVIYQVYPRSFMDGNNDGVGDLAGIIQRLDYLAQLGVKCLWISPVYPSPMYDFGYDVSDYTDIDPIFGTLTEWDTLLEHAHAKGMKLIMDLVPNHTSHLHPWFVESRQTGDNPKRDWYIWRDPGVNAGVPNNWISFFGGSAWEFDELTGQYYLHQFVKQQPELNYRNPDVLDAMLKIMRFWLDKGVDGFRVDVIWLLIKDAAFKDEPLNKNWNGDNPHARLKHTHTANQPEVHVVISAFRTQLDEYPDRVMMGEIDLPFSELMDYYGQQQNECHIPTNFSLIHTHWTAYDVGQVIHQYLDLLPEGAWPNWVLGNHDQRRLASRLGLVQAKVATVLLLTLPGTPVWYYGDELGMDNGLIAKHQIKDPQAVNQPEHAEQWGRDPERTPMQWDATANAGFSANGVKPWLPVSSDYQEKNVSVQRVQKNSFLNLFQQLMALRINEPAFTQGTFDLLPSGNTDVLAYIRSCGQRKFLVVLNFSQCMQRYQYNGFAETGRLVLSTTIRQDDLINQVNWILHPDEGCIIKLETQE
ncbi:MAG: alpha-amylase family glycosyl hydrolase [Methylococcaceae bacterium]